MARWFTADLHFGHENIIRYCDRPFVSVEEMDRALVDRWNEVVEHDDEVWCLGDVAMGPIVASLAHVSELAGRKVLVAGNHDRCWAGHQVHVPADRLAAWTDRYHEAGFDEILQGTVELELGGQRVLASHFPYEGDSHDDDRFVPHRPVDDGETWLLHGHVHDTWRQKDRMINVGVDAWDLRPVAEETLVGLVRASPLGGASGTTGVSGVRP